MKESRCLKQSSCRARLSLAMALALCGHLTSTALAQSGDLVVTGNSSGDSPMLIVKPDGQPQTPPPQQIFLPKTNDSFDSSPSTISGSGFFNGAYAASPYRWLGAGYAPVSPIFGGAAAVTMGLAGISHGYGGSLANLGGYRNFGGLGGFSYSAPFGGFGGYGGYGGLGGLGGLGYGMPFGGYGGYGGFGGYGLGGLGYGMPFGGYGSYGGFGGYGLGGLGYGMPFGGYGGYGGYGGFGGMGGLGGLGYGMPFGGYGGYGGFGGYGLGIPGMGMGGMGMGMGMGTSPEFGRLTSTKVIQTAPSKASGNYYAPSTVDSTASGSYYANPSSTTMAFPLNHQNTQPSYKSQKNYWGTSGSPFPKDLNSVPWSK
jgi:hypothetical protein